MRAGDHGSPRNAGGHETQRPKTDSTATLTALQERPKRAANMPPHTSNGKCQSACRGVWFRPGKRACGNKGGEVY